MRIAIIQFPGSNCERETMLAVKRAGMQPVEFLWNQPRNDLKHFEGYIIVGGFSYEDRSRSGIIAALDPVMQALREEGRKGKPILGICNGAQILVESGLVPGLENDQLGAALTDNKRLRQGKILGTGYYNDWIYMRLTDQYQAGAFTRHLSPSQPLRVPIAHGEGRFLIPPALLQEMQAQGMNLFQYCAEDGSIRDEFPVNPNGSVDNLAAISNKAGNIMAMMPHPERTTNGDAIFASMRDYIKAGHYQTVSALRYQPQPLQIQNYAQPGKSKALVVELVITDNQAMSVNQELQRSGLDVELKRQIHWEIDCDSDATYEKILASELLFNKRKEFAHARTANTGLPHQPALLVRAREDWVGRQKLQILENQFGITGIQAIRHSVLWRVQTSDDLDLITQRVINSRILFNPYAHDCYYY